MLVVIDPGHGGRDPGAIGPTRIRESDITLSISRYLQEALLKLGLSTKLTRDKNVFVSLEDRARFANTLNASLFISVHCNAAFSRDAKGMEVYSYYSSRNGQVLAEYIHRMLVKAIPEVPDRGVRQANYAVLRLTKMPAALVETAFISNLEEEKMLSDLEFQKRVAEGIAQGIKDYMS